MKENAYSSFAAGIGLVKEGLTYKEELGLLAKRFGMTETETIERVIHDVYISGIEQAQLAEALDKSFSKFVDIEDNCFYNGDGSRLEDEYDEDKAEYAF